MNPDKQFPTPRLCGEVPGPYRPHPVEEAGLARAILTPQPDLVVADAVVEVVRAAASRR